MTLGLWAVSSPASLQVRTVSFRVDSSILTSSRLLSGLPGLVGVVTSCHLHPQSMTSGAVTPGGPIKAAGAYRTLSLLAPFPPDLWPPPRHPKPSPRRWPLPPPGARRAGHPRTGALSLLRGPAAPAARCRHRVAAETRSLPARAGPMRTPLLPRALPVLSLLLILGSGEHPPPPAAAWAAP